MIRTYILYIRLLTAVILMMAGGSLMRGGTRTDVLTPSDFGTRISYDDWGPKSFNSTATYIGFCGGGENSFRLKESGKDNKPCIITTQSGGRAKKIKVYWYGSTGNGATLEVYGKNAAYTTPTAFYSNSSSRGTKLGEVTKSEVTTEELTISGDYAFIALCAASGSSVLYFSQIEIVWESDSYADNPSKTSTTTSFPEDSYSVLWGEYFTSPTATVLAGETPVVGASLSYSSGNESVATVDASTGAVTVVETGTTTITATYAGNETYNESAGSYTLTVTDYGEFVWNASDQGYSVNEDVGIVTANSAPVIIEFLRANGDYTPRYETNVSTAESGVNGIAFYGKNVIRIAAPDGYAISGITIDYKSGEFSLTPNIGEYAWSTSSLKWIGTWTGVSPYVTLKNTSGSKLHFCSITVHYLKLENAGSVTVSSAGAATYCPINGQMVVVGDGTLSMIITGTEEDDVVVEEVIPTVPDGTGVMLHGEGTYQLYTCAGLSSPSSSTLTRNYLKGVKVTTPAVLNTYVLQNGVDGLSFYRVETAGITTVPAGKAYLEKPAGSAAKRLFFTHEDAENALTGIQTTSADKTAPTGIYNMNGMQVNHLQRGINILRHADGTTSKIVLP